MRIERRKGRGREGGGGLVRGDGRHFSFQFWLLFDGRPKGGVTFCI